MPDRKFRIALVPLDMAWGDIDENLVCAATALRHVEPGTDLVVLPEMFSTGFITEGSMLATYREDTTERTLEHVRRWVQHFGFAIAGSIIARDGGRLYNRAFVVEPGGEETYYDKHHLFSLGGEGQTFTRGEKPSPTVHYRGCNIRMMVCYDLRFPLWSRNVGMAYDLLIYPASWPDARISAWERLLPARAIENQAYVAGCNRTGADDYGTYSPGHSMVYDDRGDIVSTPADAHGIVYATLDLDRLDAHRRKFPVYRDADPFTMG